MVSGDKGFVLEGDPEPITELLGIDQGFPHLFTRNTQQDFPFYAIQYVHMSPPSLTVGDIKQCAT
jgi:hypothetical protein